MLTSYIRFLSTLQLFSASRIQFALCPAEICSMYDSEIKRTVNCACTCQVSSCIKLVAVYVDGGGDRPAADSDMHIPDAMTQRLEALAKRLAIEQKVR